MTAKEQAYFEHFAINEGAYFYHRNFDIDEREIKKIFATIKKNAHDHSNIVEIIKEPVTFGQGQRAVAFYNIYDYEDILEGTEEQLVAMGYDKDEAQLCYALVSYDQETIYRLLEKRVNPDVWICGEWSPVYSAEQQDGANGYNYVYDATCVDPQIYGLHNYYYPDPIEQLEDPTSLMFHCLFMGAAYKLIDDRIDMLGLVE